MGVKLLLLSPLQKCSGNYATICRLRDGLQRHDIECILICPSEFTSSNQLSAYLHDNCIDIVIGIHAFKSGRILKDTTCPYILILGGTDVNGNGRNTDTFRTMTAAVENASCIVAFSDSILQQFKLHWPAVNTEKLSIIPQGVTASASNFCIKTYIGECGTSFHDTTPETQHPVMANIDKYRTYNKKDIKLFSVVGGVRPVKNPLFIAKTFSDWREDQKRFTCFLVIIGSKLDEGYYQEFYKDISQLSGVVYIPGLSHENCHAAIKDSFSLVNTSNSEGMALAILEAMYLKTPVLVRGIPGNMAIVEDGQTGLVFNTPQEFVEKATNLVEQPDLIASLTQNASNYITQKHSQEVEEKSYVNLVKKVLDKKE